MCVCVCVVLCVVCGVCCVCGPLLFGVDCVWTAAVDCVLWTLDSVLWTVDGGRVVDLLVWSISVYIQDTRVQLSREISYRSSTPCILQLSLQVVTTLHFCTIELYNLFSTVYIQQPAARHVYSCKPADYFYLFHHDVITRRRFFTLQCEHTERFPRQR